MRDRHPIPNVKVVLLHPSRGGQGDEAAVSAAKWLRDHGIGVVVPRAFAERHGAALPPGCDVAEPDDVRSGFDLLIALGGDGTLLRAARLVAERGIPVMGVNLGTLGFLSAFGASQVLEAVKAAADGRLVWEGRLRMTVEVWRNGAIWSTESGCNDAYVKHGVNPRMLELTTEVGGHKMADYRADGLIIATPMGSTAYNLAAGGPIVDPGTDVFIITPICPHSLTHRPVVTSARSQITMRYTGPATVGTATLSVDGQWGESLEVGDEISVRAADMPLRLVPPHASVFSVLRHKLGWSAANHIHE